MKKFLLAAIVAGVWINISEFLRNELLLKNLWITHFESIGLVFPSSLNHNLVWLLWGFLLAASLVYMRRRMSFMATTAIGWVMAFAMMWLVMGNLNVLPEQLLPVALPWSLIEIAGAVFIARKIDKPEFDWYQL